MKTKLLDSICSSEVELTLERALFFYNGGSFTSLAVAFEYKEEEFVEPKALSRSEVMSFLPGDTKTFQTLPPGMLSVEPICWWVPSRRRKIIVRKSKMKTYTHPPLVFKIDRGRLYVARLPSDEHPDGSTLLQKPPFGGVDIHGSVMGACGVKAPKRQALQDIPEWENAFFLSVFNFPPSRKKPTPLGVTLDQWI